jgi:osmotically-inducible protein OsmY
MRIAHQFALVAVMGLSAVMLGGCSVASHQETMGQYVDGSVITTRVKAKLVDELGAADAANISVKTIQGGVVQLSGFAKTQKERTRAGEVARSVSGVTEVHNDLVVVP